MRLWHYELIPYLPDLQFKGQLRELVAIMHDWRDKGKTNHLLINRVMDYPKEELSSYYLWYATEYLRRIGKDLSVKYDDEFKEFSKSKNWLDGLLKGALFDGWHNKEYLRVCMANLYEKHVFGIGKSRITDKEWNTLLRGYKQITGEDYVI